MSLECLSEKWVIARKEHKCTYCGLTIEKGERYHYSFIVNWRDAYPWKAHRFCKEQAGKFIRDNWYDYASEGLCSGDFQECMYHWYENKIKSLEESCLYPTPT